MATHVGKRNGDGDRMAVVPVTSAVSQSWAVFFSAGCAGLWDNMSCWPSSAPGQTVEVECPRFLRMLTRSRNGNHATHGPGKWLWGGPWVGPQQWVKQWGQEVGEML